MRTLVLEPIVKPLNKILFSSEHWSFKHDLALVRKGNYQGLTPGDFLDFITLGN